MAKLSLLWLVGQATSCFPPVPLQCVSPEQISGWFYSLKKVSAAARLKY